MMEYWNKEKAELLRAFLAEFPETEASVARFLEETRTVPASTQQFAEVLDRAALILLRRYADEGISPHAKEPVYQLLRWAQGFPIQNKLRYTLLEGIENSVDPQPPSMN